MEVREELRLTGGHAWCSLRGHGGYLAPKVASMAWFTSDFNQFFKDLAKNNNKEWFDANRTRYEASVKKPFEVFVTEAIKRIGKHDKSVSIEAVGSQFPHQQGHPFQQGQDAVQAGGFGHRLTCRTQGPQHTGHLLRLRSGEREILWRLLFAGEGADTRHP